MRAAFTLVELLVVLVIMTLVMGVVIPQGSKMLSGYEHTMGRLKEEENLSQMRARAFLEVQEYNVTVNGVLHHCTVEGVDLEERDDHR
jgi:prepilin-type N-terminal cleavage/methylation domain-containing protein